MEVQSVVPEALSGERVLTATIAFHPDWTRIGEQSTFVSRGTKENPLELSRVAPMFSRPEIRGQSPLTDGFVSRKPIFISGHGKSAIHIWCEAGGEKNCVNGQQLSQVLQFTEEEQSRGLVINMADRVILVLRRVPPKIKRWPALNLIGCSPEMDELRKLILQVADVGTPVLIHGQTGSGKELVANAIHNQSARNHQPFVAVNMAAIPKTTAVSQLFGHTKGAFSGADREHSGYFGQAHGGTLFLDEIGETSLEIQAMLLRVLETSKRQPVGSGEDHLVDVRVLAATDTNLDLAIVNGRMREPLVHRLRAFDIEVPSLEQRPEDIAVLFVHFMRLELEATGEFDNWKNQADQNELWLDCKFIEHLIAQPWTGNVRQLRNVVRKLVISNRGQTELRIPEGLLEAPNNITARTTSTPPPAATRPRSMPSEITEDVMIEVLKKHQWRAGPCADELGISRSSLYSLIEQSPNVRKSKDITKEDIAEARQQCADNLEAMAQRLQVSKRALQLRIKDLS